MAFHRWRANVEAGDYSGPVGARTVLRDPRVQAAVLETARGGLLRRGLVADDARVAVVTNVSADHFGEYGIHTLDDLAKVKLVVAKSLAPDGLLVLNADDAMLVEHASSTGVSRIGWFAFDLADALEHSAIACGVRDGRLILSIDGLAYDLGEITAMPLTVGGSARYNIANIAAASSRRSRWISTRKSSRRCWCVWRIQRGQSRQAAALGPGRCPYCSTMPTTRTACADCSPSPPDCGDGRLALLLGHAGNRLDEGHPEAGRGRGGRRSRIGSG